MAILQLDAEILSYQSGGLTHFTIPTAIVSKLCEKI